MRKNIKVPLVEILGSDSLSFFNYKIWKLGFLTSPKTCIKHVFLVQLSHLNLEKEELSATSSFGKNIDQSILDKKIISRLKKLDMWKAIQFQSLERNKNKKF
jgi:hypothetical protein